MAVRLIGKIYVGDRLVETQELMGGVDEAALVAIRQQAQRAAELTNVGLDEGESCRLEVWDPEGDIGPQNMPICTVFLSP